MRVRYGFVNEATGIKIEVLYERGKAPNYVKVGKVKFVRDYTNIGGMVKKGPSGPQPLPRGLKGVRRTDKNGDAVVQNRHDVREIEAANPGLKFNPEYYHDHNVRTG